MPALRPHPRQRAPRLLVLLLGAGCPACVSSWGGGLSLLPNAGVELTAGAPLEARPMGFASAWEANVTLQPVDDETLADDGNPEAGTWTQAGLSLRLDRPLSEGTRWTLRGGPQWFEAKDEPNIVDAPGHYVGLRLGIGFETLFGDGLRGGPEVAVLPVWGGDEHEFRLVPQLTWTLRWSPRPRATSALRE